MNYKNKIVILAVIALFITLVSAAVLTYVTLHGTGQVKAVNLTVWQDPACTVSLSEIDWGTVSPNSTYMQTVYLKSTGNADMTLSLTTSNWAPINAPDYLSVTWNRGGTILPANTTLSATISLNVAVDAVIMDFSFDITITGEG